MKCTKFVESYTQNHWNYEALSGYVYENVFEPSFFNLLKNQVYRIFNNSTTNTFLTHNTIFSINNQTKKIVSHKENDREQHVIFDLMFDEEYYFQTHESIKDWAANKINTTISPIFIKCINTFLESEPFNETNDWICYRLHLNVLEYGKFLSLHLDTNHMMYNTFNAGNARTYSTTFYMEDHIENAGGELFSVNGFVYKPKRNSAIAINGNRVLHGVTMNMRPDKKTRLAFTMRFVHIDDLFLPGHPSKCLYKPDHLESYDN
jgi:hypothetical protein